MKFGHKQTIDEKVGVASRNKSPKGAVDKKPPGKPKVSLKGTNPLKKKVGIKVTVPLKRGK